MSVRNCPICGQGELEYRDGSFETQYVNRRGSVLPLTVANVKRLHCNSCGEEILEDADTRQVEEARRAAAGLLSAAEIRELRLSFGRTQVQMSRLLGVGEKTYCRWESGSFIQSVAFDNYLRLLREIPETGPMLIRFEENAANTDNREEAFTFLTNIDVVNESAERFTKLLVAGMLHVPAGSHA
jgi:putative zinc finger/helix-turn-helix YgiT family protein